MNTLNNIKKIHSNLFFVGDLENTSEFYEKLGFDIQKSKDVVRIRLGDFTMAFMDESKVHFDKESGMKPKGLGIFTYIEVADVDAQYEFTKQNGINPSSEPQDYLWGKREFAVKDPDGYKIVFFQQLQTD